jgi:hypothetical protein
VRKIEYSLLSAVYPRLPRMYVLLAWTCRLPTALEDRLHGKAVHSETAA